MRTKDPLTKATVFNMFDEPPPGEKSEFDCSMMLTEPVKAIETKVETKKTEKPVPPEKPGKKDDKKAQEKLKKEEAKRKKKEDKGKRSSHSKKRTFFFVLFFFWFVSYFD